MPDLNRNKIRREFEAAVNMTAAELDRWLETSESKGVRFKRDGIGESVGHASGRHIVAILRSRAEELTDRDYAHMRKLVGYVNRDRRTS